SSGTSAVRELADDALGDVAHGVNRANHLLLANHNLVEQAFELRRYARVNQRRIGLLENPEQRQASLGWDNVLAVGDQKTLFLQSPDDLGSGRRRADALGLLQPIPQDLVIDKTPGVLHGLDQGAFIVARRRARLLVLDGRVFQPCDLAVAEHWQ